MARTFAMVTVGVSSLPTSSLAFRPLSEAHPRSSAVLIDEFDARGFERAANGKLVRSGQ
jgi:hypothetical protein